jgi:LacI family transcriptional regulator
MGKSAKPIVTIREVATRAKVSVATASRALNGGGYASEETRQRVNLAARELGYKPNAAARSLKLQRTKTVGLMVADVINPFYSYLADGVLACAKRHGYHVILSATNEDPVMEREYLEVLMENRVDGIITVPTGHNLKVWREAIDLGTKLVLVDREIAGLPNVDAVLVDNARGAREATSYLLGLGHRRIAIINGPTTTTTGKGRLQGYLDALAAAGISSDPALVQLGSFRRESGFDAVKRLLALEQPPTAIFATNNVLGEAAMFALREHGMKIPDAVSLLMFDDVPWASLSSPRLTVVTQPTYDLGFTSMERLFQRLQEARPSQRGPQKAVLQPALIMRDSCAPPAEIDKVTR